ncbi:MAG: hypothetical protein HUK07_00980, partial [Bacteroidaceae bacterium]|nr:hypothetical protein [Bacteroidaceae bacterium]
MKRFLCILYFLLAFLGLKAQTFTLQGRVTDTNGSPIEFCSVSIPKQARATMTNLNGEYVLTASSA